jgi:hypothetical protein
MLPYLSNEGQQNGVWRQAGAGGVTQRNPAPNCAVELLRKFSLGLTQNCQYPQKNQHDFPAALPLRRAPESGIAAF